MKLWVVLAVAVGTPFAGPLVAADAGEGTNAVAPAALPATDDAATAVRDDYMRQTSRQMFLLNAWGDASLIGSGLGFLAARSAFARGFELQSAVWGLGAAAVAVWGLYQRKHHPPPAGSLETWAGLRHDARAERRANAGIDLALLIASLAAWRGLRAPRWRGMAAGVALQCGFLTILNFFSSLAFGT